MKKNMLTLGLILLAIPIYLLLQKLYLEMRYDLYHLDKNQFSIAGKKIEIEDDFPNGLMSTESVDEIPGIVRIKINGIDYSSHTQLTISPNLEGKDRYQGWLGVFKLVDNFSKETLIVIAQRLDESKQDPSKLEETRFRFIYVPLKGKTWTETLSLGELRAIARSKSPILPYYKVWMANFVRPEDIAYLKYEPGRIWLMRWYYIEPFIILLSGIVGLLLIILGIWHLARLRTKTASNSQI